MAYSMSPMLHIASISACLSILVLGVEMVDDLCKLRDLFAHLVMQVREHIAGLVHDWYPSCPSWIGVRHRRAFATSMGFRAAEGGAAEMPAHRGYILNLHLQYDDTVIRPV